MVYFRVIPRDLFNEANLLKCLGQLVLKLENLDHTAFLEEPTRAGPFVIEQDQSSGAIEVMNLPFTVRGKPWRLTRPLNSRNPWPLYAENDDEAIPVFTDGGDLGEQFKQLIAP